MLYQESDNDLLDACRNDDAAAWERLVERYQRLVFSIPLNHGVPHDEAADIVQITFTILLQSLDRLRGETHLGGWLATVARRHTWRLLNHRKREQVNEGEDLAESTLLLGEATTDSHERWERVEWLEQALARLKERCRALLLALYFDHSEPSYAEVAERLGIAVGSVGPTRARCLEQMRAALQPER